MQVSDQSARALFVELELLQIGRAVTPPKTPSLIYNRTRLFTVKISQVLGAASIITVGPVAHRAHKVGISLRVEVGYDQWNQGRQHWGSRSLTRPLRQEEDDYARCHELRPILTGARRRSVTSSVRSPGACNEPVRKKPARPVRLVACPLPTHVVALLGVTGLSRKWPSPFRTSRRLHDCGQRRRSEKDIIAHRVIHARGIQSFSTTPTLYLALGWASYRAPGDPCDDCHEVSVVPHYAIVHTVCVLFRADGISKPDTCETPHDHFIRDSTGQRDNYFSGGVSHATRRNNTQSRVEKTQPRGPTPCNATGGDCISRTQKNNLQSSRQRCCEQIWKFWKVVPRPLNNLAQCPMKTERKTGSSTGQGTANLNSSRLHGTVSAYDAPEARAVHPWCNVLKTGNRLKPESAISDELSELQIFLAPTQLDKWPFSNFVFVNTLLLLTPFFFCVYYRSGFVSTAGYQLHRFLSFSMDKVEEKKCSQTLNRLRGRRTRQEANAQPHHRTSASPIIEK
ncbi:hypothetical protein BC835DRAFT_1305225 [Cytidiella melzeri]|nr:hypothetical protein BC835DRAFT_1305225 [Cytidiella melzeri]